jgi:GNAT superfamily N-acetyltransferase
MSELPAFINDLSILGKRGDLEMKIEEMQVKEVVDKKGFIAAYPVMHQLRTHLELDQFLATVEEMREQGYRIFTLEVENKIVAVTGVAIQTNLYNGRHLYVYDLVTDQNNRSAGYGEKLLDFIHKFSKDNGCSLVELSSGLQRVDAHRFYVNKMGYTKASYSFRKGL